MCDDGQRLESLEILSVLSELITSQFELSAIVKCTLLHTA